MTTGRPAARARTPLRRLLAALRSRRTAARAPFLDGDVFVGRGPGGVVRLRLQDVRQVTVGWTPYVGAELVVQGGGQQVRLPLAAATQELRAEVGRRVVRNGPSVAEAPDVRALLGLP